jgi:acetyl/propionyl-CoA carboxylase alpha subunit
MPANDKIYEVKANGFLFSFTEKEIEDADLLFTSPSEVNLLLDFHSLNARIIETDASGKKLKIKLEGNEFSVEIKDELDQALEQMGFGKKTNQAIKQIKAPMPGLVLEINVTDGQEVNEGDKLLILEAMKMENSIMIHVQAKIKKIAVTAGQAVEKGQVLVELE